MASANLPDPITIARIEAMNALYRATHAPTKAQRWLLDQTDVLEAIADERQQETEEDHRREYDDRLIEEMQFQMEVE